MRPTARLQQGPLPCRTTDAVVQVILLGNGSLQAPPVDGAALPFADVSVQYVLDVLYDEVDGHWEETTRFKTFTLGIM